MRHRFVPCLLVVVAVTAMSVFVALASDALAGEALAVAMYTAFGRAIRLGRSVYLI